MFREWSYRVAVYDIDGARVPVSQLEQVFSALVQDARQREQQDEVCVPIGRLTADDRDTWATASPSLRAPSVCIGVSDNQLYRTASV